MDHSEIDLEKVVPLAGMLGFLNFSEGKPDARFQKQLNDAYAYLAGQGLPEPWTVLQAQLTAKLDTLHGGVSSAFRDATQARAVLALVFAHCLPAYRRHHADLLFHLEDADLYGPFFLARVFEAVMTQGSPWNETERIVTGALAFLNDFVGHRPVAILETRPRGEPYDRERVRPIPLFVQGAGTAWGRYRDLIARALDLIQAADPAILAEASFSPDLLDELAMDPRPYDQGHPVNRRPNYVFGEWDPDHLDGQGRFRRFVVRQLILDGLLERVGRPESLDAGEVLFEAAAVLAGTILMAAGISGGSPSAHDSTTTLATLIPRIARYRDAFYTNLLNSSEGSHGVRLRQEVATTRQPFGRARQHLNEFLARHRALQLQQRHLALIFTEMGYPEAGRREAARIPAASVRLLSAIHGRLTTGRLQADRGELAAAAGLLPEIEDLLQRGIACGALVDPWNILGFQGLFPLFASREDSVRDTRIDDLILVVEQILNLYNRLMSEAAAVGEKGLVAELKPALRRFAAWWDKFASVEVQDVRRVLGAEVVTSAEHVAMALGRWHEQGEAAGDLAFWKRQLEGFRSPKAFALVVEALLRKEDYGAAMALLMNWIGQVDQVPLADGVYSFHLLAVRWMLAVTAMEGPAPARLIPKFFDYLEANAGDYWHVPALDLEDASPGSLADEEDEDLYGAAYEGVTFQDSADDNQEGAVWDGGPMPKEFVLETEAVPIEKRLHFLAILARLWHVAAHQYWELQPDDRAGREALAGWLASARDNQRRLLALLDALNGYQVPQPLGSHESMVDYDRQRVIKEQLLYVVIGACLDTVMAAGTLRGCLGESGVTSSSSQEENDLSAPPWESAVIRLERALWQGRGEEARTLLPLFVEQFRAEPLLFAALAFGGQPRHILRTRLAQTVLRALVTILPSLGLVRETYHLLQTARVMESANRTEGRGVSEFNTLFQAGFTAVVQAVVESAESWDPGVVDDAQLVKLLEMLTGPFLKLWIEHGQTLQLSALETWRGEKEWAGLREFIQRYGGDLFHARFLTLANLRGILHRGVGPYLDYLRDNPDPLHPVRLIDDLDSVIPRERAERCLEFVLRALVENYEEYKDYNTSTAQSDYGENLHLLLDFLRLKASYERQAWQFRPLMMVHEVLARETLNEAAFQWQGAFTRIAQELAGRHLEELSRLEQIHGIRLRTVSDRLQERFVKPLVLDRLCALIDPAMEDARQGGLGEDFRQLEKELAEQTAHPTGVGLDVPPWLRRMEDEVLRVQVGRSAVGVLAEQLPRVPRKNLTLLDLQNQLREWEKPL